MWKKIFYKPKKWRLGFRPQTWGGRMAVKKKTLICVYLFLYAYLFMLFNSDYFSTEALNSASASADYGLPCR